MQVFHEGTLFPFGGTAVRCGARRESGGSFLRQREDPPGQGPRLFPVARPQGPLKLIGKGKLSQMLKIQQRRLPVELRPEEAHQVQQNLQARFNSLLAGVRLEYLRRLGLDAEPSTLFGPQQNSSLAAGEIFMPEPGTIFYIKYVREDKCLEAGAISNREGDFSNFFGEVRDCVLQIRRVDQDWESPRSQGPAPEGARPADVEVSEKELEAAREFMNPASRELLARLASSESTLFKELKTADHPGVEDQLAHFEDLDLIRKDYAVIDKKTGQQILRVPNRASLEEASTKFFIGGTPISEDTVDEVISCTPFCRSLLVNEQWLLFLLLGTLGSLGFDSGAVQVCQSENAPTRVFLNLDEQRFLVVLTNRRLTLDDAYLISAQVAAYGLTDVALVSTTRTSTLMRHHLENTNPDTTFSFIDTLDDLEERIRSVLLEKQRTYVRSLLDPLAELTPVKIQDLVIRKMLPDAGSDVQEVPPDLPISEPFESSGQDVLPRFDPPPMEAPGQGPAARELPDLPPPPPAEPESRPRPELSLEDKLPPPPPMTEPEPEIPDPRAASGLGEPPAGRPLPEPDLSPELPSPDEPMPDDLQMEEIVPDLPSVEEMVPDIPSPVDDEASAPAHKE